MENTRQQEFLELINAHRAVIYKVVNLYVDGRDERNDMVQEVLLQAYKGFSRFRGDSKFSTWLYRVALNTIFSFSRKEQNRIIAEKESQTFDDITDFSDEAAELYFHIKNLDDINKMIITLHLEGFSNKEIADITGMTSNNIGVKLFRIRELLSEKMNKTA
ncbi:MAG: RNA polymerase sigma factor [Bacteroidia bacterium]